MDLVALLKSSGLVVQVVLLSLILGSIWTWAIVFTKLGALKKSIQQNKKFLDAFWKSGSLETIYAEAAAINDCPLANIFKSGYVEVQKLMDVQRPANDAPLVGLDNVMRSLKKSFNTEVAVLEKRIPWLATIGSVAPFVGLFGTVWGIMKSFTGLASEGNASISAVAPGIAEALIATAVGLACAIPAVVAYNYFLGRLKMIRTDMNNFCIDYVNLIKRNLF